MKVVAAAEKVSCRTSAGRSAATASPAGWAVGRLGVDKPVSLGPLCNQAAGPLLLRSPGESVNRGSPHYAPLRLRASL
ncbi:hypothetical protein MRX96_026216 [Rhipicephalus microplus]